MPTWSAWTRWVTGPVTLLYGSMTLKIPWRQFVASYRLRSLPDLFPLSYIMLSSSIYLKLSYLLQLKHGILENHSPVCRYSIPLFLAGDEQNKMLRHSEPKGRYRDWKSFLFRQLQPGSDIPLQSNTMQRRSSVKQNPNQVSITWTKHWAKLPLQCSKASLNAVRGLKNWAVIWTGLRLWLLIKQ